MIQYFVVFVKTKMEDNQGKFSVRLNRRGRFLFSRRCGYNLLDLGVSNEGIRCIIRLVNFSMCLCANPPEAANGRGARKDEYG